jgi:hypothetical protein
MSPINDSDLRSGSQDIFRKYPSTYEGVIPTLCANLEELDEPEAKASLIWIIGEYAEKIDNAVELLTIFVDSFGDDAYAVRSFPFIRNSSRSSNIGLGADGRIGPTPNAHCSRQVVPKATRPDAGTLTAHA